MLGYVVIHVQPNFPHQMTRDRLLFEAGKGCLDRVRDLVKEGADINIKDEKGVSE